MSLFAEILCNQFPDITFPSINYTSISRLKRSYTYSSVYYNSIQLIYHTYFMRYKKTYKKDSINKFDIFDFVILKDKELTIVEKNHFLQKFSKAQLHYSSFRKLAKLFKLKRYREFEIDTDLCFQPFSNLNKSMLISLLENNILYKFRISDLINIANKSLSHSPYFFAEPCSIKNPYTNIPFSTANLYNLYFKIQETNYIMPFLFHLYFVSDFNLNKFKN